MQWIRDRALTLVLMTMFGVFLSGQFVTGLNEYNATQAEHGEPVVAMSEYLTTGHGGFAAFVADEMSHGQPRPELTEYVVSSRFWFESFQNWQSEFLAIAAMVWFAVYLRQRWSPESKPVHAPHDETGR
jgi:hypothetical protein